MVTVTCPSRERLLQYSSGMLSDEQSDGLAGHLETCPECQATIVALGDAEDTLIGRLRAPVGGDSFLGEPQLQAAMDHAIAALPAGEDPSGMGLRPVPELPARPDIPEMPETLGEYRIHEPLGRGGMGQVYKALHTKLDRVVAIKILSGGRIEDRQAIARFEREMKAIGRLDHPNIVRAYDAREEDGMRYLVMEYVEGLDLAEVVRRVGPLPVAEACEVVRQTALGLQRAHEHGLVHRDIKPSNLMLAVSGEPSTFSYQQSAVSGQPSDLGSSREKERESPIAESCPLRASIKILDLGLACFFADSPASEEMTGTGQAMGTADYMAPEQAADSRTVDIRADLYSLGCTLYKLLSGRAPFSGPEYRSTLDKLNAHVNRPVPSIRGLVPDVPERLAAILDRMLAKVPGDRFATPAEVAAALEPICAGANLGDLATRASSGVASHPEPGDARGEPHDRSATPFVPQGVPPRPARRRSIIKTALIALGLLGTIATAFAAGVVITIQKSGKTYQVEVPEGSHVVVGEDGNATVDVSSKPGGLAPLVVRNLTLVREVRGYGDFVPFEKTEFAAGQEVILYAEVENFKSEETPKGYRTRFHGSYEISDARGQGVASQDLGNTDEHCRNQRRDLYLSYLFRLPKRIHDGWYTLRLTVKDLHGQRIGQSSLKFTIKAIDEAGGVARLESSDGRGESRERPVTPFAKPQSVPLGPAVDAAAELRRLQGQWKVVRVEKGGEADPVWSVYGNRDLNIATVAEWWFQDADVSFRWTEGGTDKWLGLSYRIDPKARPKTIDIRGNTPSGILNELFVANGIYEIDGDRMKICLVPRLAALKIEERPQRFSAGQNSREMLFVLERRLSPRDAQLRTSREYPATPGAKQQGVPPGPRPKEEELARMVQSMPGIDTASVVFNQETKRGPDAQLDAIALVSVKPYASEPFGEAKAAAIRNAVSGRMAGLKAENVVVIDQNSRRTFRAAPPSSSTPPEVPATRPVVRQLSRHSDSLGMIVAAQTVQIRSRVSGPLVKVLSKAGATVKQGELLFEIDPTPFQAEVDKREADVRLMQLRLNQKNSSVEGAKSAPAADRQRIEAQWAEAEAALKVAQEGLKLSKLNLASTKVTAPIAGRISSPVIAQGTLVKADTTALATIVSVDPMAMCFDVDERTDLEIRRTLLGLSGGAKEVPLCVGLQDEKGFPRQAKVESADSELISGSGWARWQALVPNPDGLLKPGMFVRVRLVTGPPRKTLLVPERAIGSDQGQTFVLVATAQNIPERRVVKIGGLDDDGLRIVEEGLTEDDRILSVPQPALPSPGGAGPSDPGKGPGKPHAGPTAPFLPQSTLTGNTEQARAIAEIEKLRGTAEKSARLAGWFVTDAALKHLEGLTQLESLSLGNAQVTDAGMVHLKGLTNLQSLDLSCTFVKDAGLENINGLTKLRTLNLHGIGVSDAGLAHLNALTDLWELSLYGTSITDAGLERLQGFTHLKSLDLGANIKINGTGLKHLRSLTQLQSLNLIWTGTTDAALEHLKGLAELESLNLYATPVTDVGLEHLRGLQNLQSLGLGRTKVTDAAIERLKGLAKLQSLVLSETRVTEAGLQRLRQALPNCRIEACR